MIQMQMRKDRIGSGNSSKYTKLHNSLVIDVDSIQDKARKLVIDSIQ